MSLNSLITFWNFTQEVAIPGPLNVEMDTRTPTVGMGLVAWVHLNQACQNDVF